MEPGRVSGAPGLATSSTLRLRVGGGRQRLHRPRSARRWLLATRDAFEPFDLLHVRDEDCLRRVLGELGPDRVRLAGDECEPFTANEVGALDAFEERPRLFGRCLPAERVVLQLTDFVERLPMAWDTLSSTPMTLIDASRTGFEWSRTRCLSCLRYSCVNGATPSICDRMVRNCAMTASGERLVEPGSILVMDTILHCGSGRRLRHDRPTATAELSKLGLKCGDTSRKLLELRARLSDC